MLGLHLVCIRLNILYRLLGLGGGGVVGGGDYGRRLLIMGSSACLATWHYISL